MKKVNNVKYDKAQILKRAWSLYKNIENKVDNSFAICLRQSWHIAKNGNNASTFNEIYKKYNKQVYYHVLTKVFQKTEVAEEITQEVFIRLHRHFDNYDVYKAKLNTWLFSIANNLVIDYIRANKDQNTNINVSNFCNEEGEEVFQFHASDSDEASYDVENTELSATMLKAFRTLKPKYRKIAVLYFIREKQYNEIAEICNVPLGTVQGMIFRVRAMLQKELSQCTMTNV